MHPFLKNVHPSWSAILSQALDKVEPLYLQSLLDDASWLPGTSHILNAFSIPKAQTRYILLGESPYPRPLSSNGYAFWDASVKSLWSATGFSKPVNRATSLRNWIKMLLVARGDLQESDVSQGAIAHLNKANYVQTGEGLFKNFLEKGFLLLNASLVFRNAQTVKQDAKAWFPFLENLLKALREDDIQLILMGNIAKKINQTKDISVFKTLSVEHPYNISFIHNTFVQDFFRPLDLLKNEPS
jgi:uracil-DNA glycosylase